MKNSSVMTNGTKVKLLVVFLLPLILFSCNGAKADITPSPTPTISASVDPVPYVTGSNKSGLHKDTKNQKVTSNKWINFQGGGFTLNGDRSLFFAQLHLTCTKNPKYVKIRLARHLKNGKLDTTGTNTWVLGKGTPKNWQGSTWWESRTFHPITAQFYVGGGKCVSPQRQFKYWQP